MWGWRGGWVGMYTSVKMPTESRRGCWSPESGNKFGPSTKEVWSLNYGTISSVPSPLLFLKQGISVNTELINLSKMNCQEVPGIFLFLSPELWDYRCISSYPDFSLGAWNKNSGPHPWVPSSLLTEPSSQLLVRCFITIILELLL